MTIRELIANLEARFERLANAEKAIKMSAYMKHQFIFFGISAPDRSAIQRDWFPLVKKHQPDFWTLILELWEKDEREFQMVAVDLSNMLDLSTKI